MVSRTCPDPKTQSTYGKNFFTIFSLAFVTGLKVRTFGGTADARSVTILMQVVGVLALEVSVHVRTVTATMWPFAVPVWAIVASWTQKNAFGPAHTKKL